MNTDVLPNTFRAHKGREAFTVVELLVACAVLALIAGILLPAVSRSREAARRLDCTHRLHQVGLALHSHHDVYGHLPAGWRPDATGASAFGWFVHLLPFGEEESVYHSVQLDLPLADGTNASVRGTSLSLAVCPSDVQEPQFALYRETGAHESGGQQSHTVLVWLASANFLGVFGTKDPDNVPGSTGDGSFLECRPKRFADLERGLSDTLLVGERTGSKLPSSWLGFAKDGEDAASRVVGFAGTGPNRDNSDESEFSSRHPGCANFLWADGHVTSVPDSIDRATYQRLATRGQNAK